MAANYVLNPYLGEVNPGTADGLKLYNKAVAAPDSKIKIDQSNARDIKTTFEQDANNFGWGPATNAIQVDNAAPPTMKNILTQAREITLECVQKAARRTWFALAPVFVWADPLPADFHCWTH